MMAPYTNAGPLAGLRIVDLSMFVAGPFATAMLGDLGAEIIKVEPPGGDPMRRNKIGPAIGDTSAQFNTYNHGKNSVVLNLKSAAGREVLLDLVAVADVVFDNFRPGVMARLNLDHGALAARNPKIVAVSLSAFGEHGPWAKRPGYDLLVQALSGGMSLTGHAETGPAHIPFHLGDTAGGLYAAVAMLAAVHQARTTGRGRAYEVSMLDGQLHLLSDEVTFHYASDWPGAPHGSGHPALAPYGAFDTADGPIVIAAVGVEKFWLNLLGALGLEELAEDERFVDNGARAAHRAALDEILGDVLIVRTQAAWLEIFAEADVPAAPVLSVAEAVATDHVAARGLVAPVATADGAEAMVPRVPIRTRGSAAQPALAGTPPLDRDRLAVLGKLVGYSDADLTRLATDGAFG